MPRGSQTCVMNKPAQNDGLVRGGRAVAEKAGEQQRVASGYARLPRTAATERVDTGVGCPATKLRRVTRRIEGGPGNLPRSGQGETRHASSSRL